MDLSKRRTDKWKWRDATVAVLAAALAAQACGGTTTPAPPAAPVVPAAWSTSTELAGLDLSTLWGSGDDLFAAGQGASIAHSSDGGQSWVTIDTQVAGTGLTFRHIVGTGPTDVWIAGALASGESVLVHSQDRGATWQRHDLGGAAALTGVWTLDGNTILLTTGEGAILRSADAGATWTQVLAAGGPPLYALWAGAGAVYAVGGVAAVSGSPEPSASVSDGCDGGGADAQAEAAGAGVILRSVDAGTTWTAVNAAPADVLWNVSGTADGGVIVAGGAHESIVVSYDYGATWLAEGRSVSPIDLTDVWVDPGNGSIFFAADVGIVRDLAYQCSGPVGLTLEHLPPAANGGDGAVAVWGATSDDVWAVGPGGVVRHRH